MARGGAREGAGRPKGALTIRTRQIAEEASQKGVTPLEVMLDNMRFHYTEATEFMQRLIDKAQEAGPLEVEQLQGLLKHLESVRTKAQDCARDAAPYIHARISTIQGNPEQPLVLTVIERRIVKAG